MNDSDRILALEEALATAIGYWAATWDGWARHGEPEYRRCVELLTATISGAAVFEAKKRAAAR